MAPAPPPYRNKSGRDARGPGRVGEGLSDCRAQRIPGPHREQAEPNRCGDVTAAAKPRSVLKKGEGLQAEGGKSRVAAADPGHDEQFCVGRNIKSATCVGECKEKSDYEGSGDID